MFDRQTGAFKYQSCHLKAQDIATKEQLLVLVHEDTATVHRAVGREATKTASIT